MVAAMTLSRSVVLAFGVLAACGGSTSTTSAAPKSGDATVVSADGVTLHYRTAGAGEPTVVLVHCWGCSADEWSGAMAALAPTHRVVALDLAGHGQSGKNRRAWTVPAFAADVRAVIDHLGIQRAILVGHSMSGPIVVEAAAEMPGKIAGVIPIDTLLDVGKAEDPAEITQFFDAMRQDFRATAEKIVRSLFPKTADPALVQRVVDFELANDPAVAIPVLENNWRFDARTPFTKVAVPILSINADLYPTNVEGNRSLNAHYDARIITGVGHWPMLEAPDRFNALLVQAVHDIAK